VLPVKGGGVKTANRYGRETSPGSGGGAGSLPYRGHSRKHGQWVGDFSREEGQQMVEW